MKHWLKRGAALVILALALMQAGSGSLPAAAEELQPRITHEESAAIYTSPIHRSTTMHTTTAAETADGSITTLSRAGERTRIAVSLSAEALAASKGAAVALTLPPLAADAVQDAHLSLELPQNTQATLALPLAEPARAADVFLLAPDGSQTPLASHTNNGHLVFTLSAGDTVHLSLR